MDFFNTVINDCGTIPTKLIVIIAGVVILTSAAIIMEKYYEKNK